LTEGPRILWFNPSCDHQWIYGDRHPLPRAASLMETAFSSLPSIVARPTDCVVSAPACEHMVQAWRILRRELPIFIDPGAEHEALDVPTHGGPWRACPFGWSPDIARRLSNAQQRGAMIDAHNEGALAEFVHVAAAANRKSIAVEVLADWLRASSDARLSCASTIGTVHTSADDAMARVRAVRRDVGSCVVKTDRGSGGRGALRVHEGVGDDVIARWLQHRLHHHSNVVVEPWLHRRADISALATVDHEGRMNRVGVSRFVSDRQGQYRGAMIRGQGVDPLAGDDPRAAADHAIRSLGVAWIHEVMEESLRRSSAALAALGYMGPFGVDAFIHDGPDGAPQLRPIVEINARWTMGFYADALRTWIDPEALGLWLLVRRGDVDAPAAFPARVRNHFPIEVTPQPRARQIRSGALFTSPSSGVEHFWSVLFVATSFASIREGLQRCGAEATFARVANWVSA